MRLPGRDGGVRLLRIHLENGAGYTRIRLEGKLVGPWVKELERCWQCVLTHATSLLTVELDEVTFVDSEGQLLLKAMYESGAELKARGTLSGFVVERIEKEAVLVVSGAGIPEKEALD